MHPTPEVEDEKRRKEGERERREKRRICDDQSLFLSVLRGAGAAAAAAVTAAAAATESCAFFLLFFDADAAAAAAAAAAFLSRAVVGATVVVVEAAPCALGRPRALVMTVPVVAVDAVLVLLVTRCLGATARFVVVGAGTGAGGGGGGMAPRPRGPDSAALTAPFAVPFALAVRPLADRVGLAGSTFSALSAAAPDPLRGDAARAAAPDLAAVVAPPAGRTGEYGRGRGLADFGDSTCEGWTLARDAPRFFGCAVVDATFVRFLGLGRSAGGAFS